jgi:uncharacterized protein
LKYLDNYRVSFNGLDNGVHDFEFTINHKFFEHFERSEIEQAALKIIVTVHKQTKTFLFDITIQGSVKVICDRCLDYFDQPINKQYKLIIKLGDKHMEISEDTILIPEAENKINLAQYFYEYIHLSLPVQRIHPDDKKGRPTCNTEMMQKLEELKSKNALSNTEIDPRWEKLKNIQLN